MYRRDKENNRDPLPNWEYRYVAGQYPTDAYAADYSGEWTPLVHADPEAPRFKTAYAIHRFEPPGSGNPRDHGPVLNVVDTEEEAKTLVYHLNYEIKAWHGDAKKVLNATAFLDEKWAKEHTGNSRSS